MEVRTDDILADIRSFERELDALLSESPGPLVDELRVWRVYAGLEKAVATLKFRMDVESPGVFLRLPRSRRPVEFLRESGRLLSTAEAALSRERLPEALRHMRNARNNLRAVLTERSRSRTRAASESKRDGRVQNVVGAED